MIPDGVQSGRFRAKPFRRCARPLLTLVLILLSTGTLRTQPIDSVEIKIGQMIMVGFRGMSAPDTSSIARDIRDGLIGGVILFDTDVPAKRPERNIGDHRQVRRLCRQLQAYAPVPLLIAVDQEGGKVARLNERRGFPRTRSQEEIGRIDHPDTTVRSAGRIADLLRRLGINMNLAPVVDVNVDPESPAIGRLGRSYSADPEMVVRHARLTLEEFARHGIIGTIKHYPGHGSARGDSHLGFTDITGTYRYDELMPFRALIAAGVVPCVMTAHVFHRSMDADHPATLSRRLVTGQLRDSLRFDGVVISDDLQMKAVSERYALDSAIVLAVRAGIDILLFANNSHVYEADIARRAHVILLDALRDGRIPPKSVHRAYRRIMTLKEPLRMDRPEQ